MKHKDQTDPSSIADFERQAWQGAAAVYEDYVAFMTATSGQRDLILGVADVDKTSEVLDVGCGPGLLASQLEDSVKRIVGIDFASNMISEAVQRFPSIEFYEADAEATQFEDRSFDCVVVNYCAHHLARPEKAFQECRRILRERGRIVIVHPIQARQACWGSFLKALVQELPPETNPSGPLFDLAEPDDYRSLLADCGFAEPQCEALTKPVKLESLDTLLHAAWAVTGLNDQPEHIQNRIKAQTIENASQHKLGDGSYEFPDEVLLAWAYRP